MKKIKVVCERRKERKVRERTNDYKRKHDSRKADVCVCVAVVYSMEYDLNLKQKNANEKIKNVWMWIICMNAVSFFFFLKTRRFSAGVAVDFFFCSWSIVAKKKKRRKFFLSFFAFFFLRRQHGSRKEMKVKSQKEEGFALPSSFTYFSLPLQGHMNS